jgi:hypothetical protein
MPETKFKVLEEVKARELNPLKRANSHLALGVFYTLEGMAAEVEREFQILDDNNSHSPIAQRLLRIIESGMPARWSYAQTLLQARLVKRHLFV